MFSRIVLAPFIFLAIWLLYLNWNNYGEYSFYLIPVVIIIIIIHVFAPQVDWWWWQRHPPLPHKGMMSFFEKKYAILQRFSAADKKKFFHRMQLFIFAKEFMPKGMETIPEDVKAIIASNAVLMSMGKEKFLPPHFEMIIVYAQAFPSPQYPKDFHASEIFSHDGAMLFSGEHLVKSFLEPNKYYNIGLHEFAKVYMYNHPKVDWDLLPKATWEDLAQVSGFSLEDIKIWIGIDDVEERAVSICHFFMFPAAFEKVLPTLYNVYQHEFKTA